MGGDADARGYRADAAEAMLFDLAAASAVVEVSA